MGYIYIGCMLLMKIVQCIFNKKSSVQLSKRNMFLSFSLFNYSICAIFGLLMILFLEKVSFPSMGIIMVSFLAGGSMAACTMSSLVAMQSGTVTLCNLAAAAGIIIPCITGVFLFQETISVWQIIGIGFLLFAAYLLAGCSAKLYGKITKKSILLLIIVMVSNGLTMVAQKMYSYYYPKSSMGLFSFIAFLSAAFILIVLIAPQFVKDGIPGLKIPGKLYWYGLAIAGALFMTNTLSPVTASLVPSVILFTLVNGGGMVITAIIGACLFKEKMSLRSIMGVFVGIASLFIINMF